MSPSHARQREREGLERAMVAIDERLKQERETLAMLAKLMKEGNEAQSEYRERRAERWRVERRIETLGAERKVLEQGSKALSTGGTHHPERNDTQELSRTEQNLRSFLSEAYSPTRATFRPASRRPGVRHRNHLSAPNMRPRRMTLNDVQPMKLRRLSVEETFAEVIKGHRKTLAKAARVESGEEEDQPVALDAPNATRHIISKSLPESLSVQPPPLTSVMEDDECVERNHSPSFSSSSDPEQDDYPLSPDTGTALIFRHHLLPRDVDDDDIEFEIPAYAKDLVTQFDQNRSQVDVGLAI
ncbi:hypothetical protein V5O48_004003, partial [Marasmius crinis-equi]